MKTRSILAGALVLGLALTGCSGSGDGPAVTSSPSQAGGTVNYVLPTSWANVSSLKDAVAAFEAKEGIKVELQAIPDENYNSVVGSRLAGGTDIDIFAGSYSLFDVPNVMVDVSDEDFGKRMPEASVASLTYSDGKIYSFPAPTPGATFGVFYNRKVFEKAGVAVPGSTDELTAAMAKLKSAGVTPLYLAGKDGWTLLQHRNSVNALMNLDGNVIGDLNKNALRWDAVPELQKQYTALQNWAAAGYLNKDALTGTYEKSQQAVASGQTAMIINGTWAIGEIAKLSTDAAKDVGFFALPSSDGRTMLGVSGADGLHIAKNSPNLESAKKFLRFLGSAEVAQKFMDAAPGISNFNDVVVPGTAPQAMQDVSKALETGTQTLAIDNASIVPAPEADLIAAYQTLIAGKSTAEKFLTAEADGMVNSGKQAHIAGF